MSEVSFKISCIICQGLKDKESGLQTRQMRGTSPGGTEEIIKGCMLDLIGLGGGGGTDTLQCRWYLTLLQRRKRNYN